ncbi:MAG: YHYH protein [Deltaproteobacteria bacterium]|nr:YHYH protein [Deltaproteobacteria bacterium]
MQWNGWQSAGLVLVLCTPGCGDDEGSGGGAASADGTSDSGNAATDGATGSTSDDPVADSSGGSSGQSEGGFVESILSGMWADDVVITVTDDAMEFSSDGVPNHDVLEAYGLMDGTTTPVVTSATTFTIPVEPEYSAETTATGLGTIGFAISGAVYFNPYEGDGASVAIDNNFDVGGIPFLDGCNGHPLPNGGTYHYHGVPYCITDSVDVLGEHSSLIGVLLDGFPVYGPSGADGSAPADLDECSGHEGVTPEFPDGIYHYHLTEISPYSVTCYHGVVDDAGGGMMPPGPPGGDDEPTRR